MVAVSITLARLAPEWMQSDFWPAWGIFAASVAGTSLISVVPAMLVMLRRTSGAVGVLIMLVYAAAAAGITLVVTLTVNPNTARQLSSPRQLWELFGILVVFLSFAAGLSGAMLATRALGFRLTIGRRPHTPVE